MPLIPIDESPSTPKVGRLVPLDDAGQSQPLVPGDDGFRPKLDAQGKVAEAAPIDPTRQRNAQGFVQPTPEELQYGDLSEAQIAALRQSKKADVAVPFQTPPGSTRGSVIPWMTDDKGRGTLAMPEMIAAPLRGAVKGGQEALGERPVNDTSARGDILAAATMGIKPSPGYSPDLVAKGMSLSGETPKSKTPDFGVKSSVPDLVKEGFVFSPADIPKLGEKPDLATRMMSGEAGKIKLWQTASSKNQLLVNDLQAEDIGLPRGTFLNNEAFAKAEAPAKAVYEQVRTAVPEVTFDQQFKADVAKLSAADKKLEGLFPSTSANPKIAQLHDELLGKLNNQTFSGEHAPTDSVMKYIAQLRADATTNLKAIGKPDQHRLGLAQRNAADLVESTMERSIENAPSYWTSKWKSVRSELNNAHSELESASSEMTNAANATRRAAMDAPRLEQEAAADAEKTTYAKSHGDREKAVEAQRAANEAESQKLTEAERQAQQRFQSAYQKVSELQSRVTSYRENLAKAYQEQPSRQGLADQFREARKLFAKIYDARDLTNPTTGDVNSQGYAKMLAADKPLSGNAKKIADAYNTAPKSMQNPARFGHAEDYSAVDFFGAAAAMGAHEPALALGILQRPLVKNMLLSKGYQERLTGVNAGQPLAPTYPAFTPQAAVALPFASGAANGMENK